MKTSVIEVHDMLSVFSVEEVEKRISEVPGVGSVTVNHAAGNATVRYDETRLEAGDIKTAVRQRGYEAAKPAETAEPAAPPMGPGHEGHAMPDAQSAAPAPPAPEADPPPASAVPNGTPAPKSTTE